MKRLFIILLLLFLFLSSCNAEDSVDSGSDASGSSEIVGIDSKSTFEPLETEPESTWHYAALRESTPELFKPDTGEYPDDVKNAYLIFPLVYETSVNGLDCLIEFYCDTVYMHNYIFSRITVTNSGDSDVCLVMSQYAAGYFKRDDGEIYISKYNNDGFSDMCDRMILSAGKSHTFEVVFYVSDEFFNVQNSYTYILPLYIEQGSAEDTQFIEIPIPIKTN
ncbi:MAG: hypothetical protein IJD70_00060 [Clostridia bacterium]|nr:hypothetical protein [Clostridia bacterium]